MAESLRNVWCNKAETLLEVHYLEFGQFEKELFLLFFVATLRFGTQNPGFAKGMWLKIVWSLCDLDLWNWFGWKVSAWVAWFLGINLWFTCDFWGSWRWICGRSAKRVLSADHCMKSPMVRVQNPSFYILLLGMSWDFSMTAYDYFWLLLIIHLYWRVI